MSAPNCFIAIDAGTTNTRVWLVEGEAIIAHAAAMVGVRDTARDGHNDKLVQTLRALIVEVRAQSPTAQPACVAAAGMITSPIGLREVPHVLAPADVSLIAQNAWRGYLSEVCDLPFVLFPGVRCGELQSDEWWQSDVMRGEETLCVGLLSAQSFQPPFIVLNLGSHWKVIVIDEHDRIARSRTSLAGELIYATQTNTILASAVPHDKLQHLESEWCVRGMTEACRSGLARALFCVRLLELRRHTTPAERLSFLIGVYVAAEYAALQEAKIFDQNSRIVTVGNGAVLEAWNLAFAQSNICNENLPGAVESYLIAGMRQMLALS